MDHNTYKDYEAFIDAISPESSVPIEAVTRSNGCYCCADYYNNIWDSSVKLKWCMHALGSPNNFDLDVAFSGMLLLL
jgi:hypothetical protein